MKNVDLIIDNCLILTDTYDIKENQSIIIKNKQILDITSSEDTKDMYEATTNISGKNKLFMPGFVDSHMHTCQQLLRGRIADELPMIWTRIMVPFESNLTKSDVKISAELANLEMIKSGTTAFVDAGGIYMDQVAETVVESGLRGVITNSTMDIGGGLPESMVHDGDTLIKNNTELYNNFHGSGDGRLDVWFSLRSIISCSPELTKRVFDIAAEFDTGVQTHMNEYTNEISYCLENYQKRPFEYLEDLGVLTDKFLSAHAILLSEEEMDIIKKYDIKVAHCPISNSGKGFPKAPSLIQRGVSVGLGTDGTAHGGLSILDEIRTLKALSKYWGVPIFDPRIMPSKLLLELATLGGAKAMQKETEFGTLEVGKKADMIGINIDQAHIYPTHDLVNTLVETINNNDISDMVVDGQIIMKDREVLTMDEERIKFEGAQAMKDIAQRANI